MAIKINGDNSVANPGFTGDDTDTGLQVGTDELKLVTGGTARATVDSSGRVGIGTTSPGSFSSSTNNFVISETGGNSGLTLHTGTSNSSFLGFTDTGDTNNQGYIGYSHSDNALLFSANSAERARIDSSGRVGVGVTPSDFGSGANCVEIHSSGSVNSFLSLTNSTSGSGGSTNGFNVIASGTEARLFNRENGNMTFWTNASERMRILSTGGLTFNGDTAQANALDDYEEGTLTITHTGITNFGTAANAHYIKIGAQVTYMWNIFQNSNNMAVSNGDVLDFGNPFSPVTSFHTQPAIGYYKSSGPDIGYIKAYFETNGDIIITESISDIRHIWGFVTFKTDS